MTAARISDPALRARVITLVDAATTEAGTVNTHGAHTSAWWTTTLTLDDPGAVAVTCDANVQKSRATSGRVFYHIGLEPHDEDDPGPCVDTSSDGDVEWQPALGFTDPAVFLDAFDLACKSATTEMGQPS